MALVAQHKGQCESLKSKNAAEDILCQAEVAFEAAERNLYEAQLLHPPDVVAWVLKLEAMKKAYAGLLMVEQDAATKGVFTWSY